MNEGNRFVVCLQGVDLRKGLDGLCGLIRYLSMSPANGDVYVFLNKSRTTMKLLHWEQGGFVIYYKRMESGRISHKIFLKEGVGFHTIIQNLMFAFSFLCKIIYFFYSPQRFDLYQYFLLYL